MYEFLDNYCTANKDYFGTSYSINEIQTENGAGYVISYGTKEYPNSASLIISDKATIDDLNSVIELEPATGLWIANKAQPATGDKTYHEYLSQINSGDFSHVPDNAIVSIPTMYKSEYDGSLDIACGIVKAAGNDVLNIGEFGFSGSGEATQRSVADAILKDKYPTATYRCANFDAYNEENYVRTSLKYSEDERNKLTNKMEIINFIPDTNAARFNTGKSWNRYGLDENIKNNGMKGIYYSLKSFAEQGYNSKIYEVNFDKKMYYDKYQHSAYLSLGLFGTNTLDYLSGNADNIVNTGDIWGDIGLPKTLNLETGEYEAVSDEDEKDEYDTDNFEITEYDSDIINMYNDLKGINGINFPYLSDPKLNMKLNNKETIVSQLEFVKDSMDNIRTSAKEQNFLTSLRGMSFRSTTGIPGSLVGVIEQAFNAIGKLSVSLVNETDAIASIAAGYADMDIALGNRAETIANNNSNTQSSIVNVSSVDTTIGRDTM